MTDAIKQERPTEQPVKLEGSLKKGSVNPVLWCTRCASRGKLECDWCPDKPSCSSCERSQADDELLSGPCLPAGPDAWPSWTKDQQRLENLIEAHGTIERAKLAVTPLAIPMKPEERPVFRWCVRCAKEGRYDCNITSGKPCQKCEWDHEHTTGKIGPCISGKGIWPSVHDVWAKAQLENYIVAARAEGTLAAAPMPGSVDSVWVKRIYAESVKKDEALDAIMGVHRTKAIAAGGAGQTKTEKETGNKGDTPNMPFQPKACQKQSRMAPVMRKAAALYQPPKSREVEFNDREETANTTQGYSEAQLDRLVEERAKNMFLEQRLKESEAEVQRLKRLVRELTGTQYEERPSYITTRSRTSVGHSVDHGSEASRWMESERRESSSNDGTGQDYRLPRDCSIGKGQSQNRQLKRPHDLSWGDDGRQGEEPEDFQRSQHSPHDRHTISGRAQVSDHEGRDDRRGQVSDRRSSQRARYSPPDNRHASKSARLSPYDERSVDEELHGGQSYHGSDGKTPNCGAQ